MAVEIRVSRWIFVTACCCDMRDMKLVGFYLNGHPNCLWCKRWTNRKVHVYKREPCNVLIHCMRGVAIPPAILCLSEQRSFLAIADRMN